MMIEGLKFIGKGALKIVKYSLLYVVMIVAMVYAFCVVLPIVGIYVGLVAVISSIGSWAEKE